MNKREQFELYLPIQMRYSRNMYKLAQEIINAKRVVNPEAFSNSVNVRAKVSLTDRVKNHLSSLRWRDDTPTYDNTIDNPRTKVLANMYDVCREWDTSIVQINKLVTLANNGLSAGYQTVANTLNRLDIAELRIYIALNELQDPDRHKDPRSTPAKLTPYELIPWFDHKECIDTIRKETKQLGYQVNRGLVLRVV